MIPLLIIHLLTSAVDGDPCPEELVVDTQSISFGEAVIGGSISLTVGVRYSGETSLSVSSSSEAFALSAGTRLGNVVHQVPLTFSPTDAGPVSAVVVFEAGNCSHAIEVTGSGIDTSAAVDDADDGPSCSSSGSSALTALVLGCWVMRRTKRLVVNEHDAIAA